MVLHQMILLFAFSIHTKANSSNHLLFKRANTAVFLLQTREDATTRLIRQ